MATSWVVGRQTAINLETTSTSLGSQPLLTEVPANTGRFVKVKASSAIAQYDCVKIDDDGQAAPLDTTISGAEPTRCGVAQVAIASASYGWVWIGSGGGSGSGIKVTVAASCLKDVKLYTTAVAGTLDDDNTATDLIQGLKICTDDGGSGSSIECYAADEIKTNCQD